MDLSCISSVPLSNFQIFPCMTCCLTINDIFSWYCIMLQLQDLEVSAYNGPSISDTPVVKMPVPEEASQLLQPFIIHYHEGQAVSLTINAGEEQWASNMKRGLASLLQLDLSHMHTPAFVSTEVHRSLKCNTQRCGCCHCTLSHSSIEFCLAMGWTPGAPSPPPRLFSY